MENMALLLPSEINPNPSEINLFPSGLFPDGSEIYTGFGGGEFLYTLRGKLIGSEAEVYRN
jgi:hypothetical protein